MGFFDMVGGVIGGVKDIVGGGAEFAWDTSRALIKATTDPGEGIKIFVDSIQEDLLGQVLGGAFGPEGVIGSVVGELPEEIRKPFRTVLEPTMEAWDWSIQNLVDRPLGTLATVVNATKFGTNLEELFDGSTWASAWEINDERTFGQSVAAAIYNIDPFDQDAFNDIREDSLFDLISGTFDFVQEFADPLAIGLGGGANILRGKTVIATVDNAGNVRKLAGRTNFEKMGGLLEPQKIYTPGGGVFRQTLLGKPRLSKEQITARNLVGTQIVTDRVNTYLNSSSWQRVEKAMDDIGQDYVKATKGIDDTGVLFPNEANAAVNARFTLLRQTLSRKGSRMPEKAAFAIASGATPQARRLNARFVMGDMSVFREVHKAAGQATKLLNSDSFLSMVDEFGKTKNEARKAELRKQISEESAGLNSVDWVTMYDGYLGVLESQSRRVVDVAGNPTTAFPDLVNTNPDLRAMTEMMLRKITGIEVMNDLEKASEAAANGLVGKVYTDSFGDYYQLKMDALRTRRAGDDAEGGYKEYAVRSVITPVGWRKLRIFTERNPQALINFSDTQAFTQFERMLQAASRVEIPVKGEIKRIVKEKEIANYLGEWARISSRGGDPVLLKELFERVVKSLSTRADGFITESGINQKKTLTESIEQAAEDLQTGMIDDPLVIGDSLESGRTVGEAGRVRRGMDETRPGRRAISVNDQKRQSQYIVTNPETSTTHTIMTAMTPQQMRQSGVMPRWDLVNTEIRRHYRRNGSKVKRTLQQTADGVRLMTSPGRSLATASMQIWRPFVLLTPKWPGRVQLDETLRRAADLGVMVELRNLLGGFGDMRDAYAIHGVDMKLDDFVPNIMEKAEGLGVVPEVQTVTKPGYTPRYKETGKPNTYFKDYTGQELPYKMKKGYRSDGSPRFYSLREAIEDQAESGMFPENIEEWLETTGLKPDEIEVLWVAENAESAVTYGASYGPMDEFVEVPDWSPEIYIHESTNINEMITEIEDSFIDLEGAVPLLEDTEGGFLYARTKDGTPISEKTNLTETGELQVDKLKFEHLGDAIRHLENNNLTIDNLLNEQAKELTINETKRGKHLPLGLSELGNKAGLARLALGTALFGFTPAIAWSTIYSARRYQRVRNVAKRRAGLIVAEGLQVEARKLLAEALENGDAGLRQQAETMLARADGMREAIDVITPEGVSIENIDDIVDNLERAHVLMDKAGMANMSVNGATLRNAYGDTADFREIISASVSSVKSTSELLQGVTKAQQRQILDYVDADWEPWSITDKSTTRAQYIKGWDGLLGRATQISDKHPNFYKIIWSEADPKIKVEQLAKEIRSNRELRLRLGLADELKYSTDENIRNFTAKAQDIIEEFEQILPRDVGFDDLRARAAAGGNVTWNEVEIELRKWHKANVEIPSDDIRQIVFDFRKATGAEDFGVSVSPNLRTVDFSRAAFTGAMGEMVEKMFKLLGEIPADNLSRNPYYRTKYEREVNRRLARYTDADGNVNISQRTLTEIEDDARKAALGETRDLLYDLAEETRFAEMTANIFPFFNAWQEVLGRWGKLATENPYFVGKMVNLYQTPWNAKYLGMEEVSQYDEAKIAERREELGRPLTEEEKREFATASYIVFRLPKPVKNLAKVLTPGPLAQSMIENDIRFSKEGLASMLQSTTPGVGPLVSIPIREAILSDPSLEDTFKFMFPFGHPEGNFFDRTLANFTPAYAQNLRNTFMDTPTKKRQVTYFFQQILTEYEQSTPGGISSLLSNEQWVLGRIREAEERAQRFFMFRVGSGLFSPTPATLQSPYADLMVKIKDLQRQHGYDEGTALFLQEHGDEFVYLTGRMTKLNDGVAASAVSEEAYIKYQDLVQSHPEIGAWVTLSLGGKDEEYLFNQAAYRRQTTMDVSPLTPGLKRRELKSPKALIEGVDVSEGWAKYTELSDFIRTIQDDRQALGLPYSLNSSAMSDLQRFKQEQIDLIRQEHPLWGEAWDAGRDEGKMAKVIEGFVVALSDDKFSDLITTRPSARHLIDYFELRGFIEQELVRRHAEENGSLNLESNTNADLLLFWQREKEELSKRPEFSVVYDRYFENDMIPKNSFVSLLKV
jgi:hypothetical protein